MLLEAIEDHRRGWTTGKPLHEQPVIRGTASIEHIMPQEWSAHWPLEASSGTPAKRDTSVQTLGNLTLITQSLNSRVSNGPWIGKSGELKKHTSLLLTREAVELGRNAWTDEFIAERTDRMIDEILEIWPVPAGHTGNIAASIVRAFSKVEVADLVNAGMLRPGQTLYARVQAHRGRQCQVSEDGSLYVEDKRYETLSAAAKGITGSQSEAGWWFWLTDVESEQSLSDIRQEYLEALDEESEVVDVG
jgi:hypothetical protein